MKLVHNIRFSAALLVSASFLACRDSGPTDVHPPLVLPLTDKIVFASGRADTLGDVFVMNLDGSDVRQLTDASTKDACPSVSPDGNWIAYIRKFVADTALRFDLRPDSLVIMKADGTEPRAIAALWYPVAQCPLWSSNSQEIAIEELTYDMIKTTPHFKISTYSVDGHQIASFTAYGFSGLSFSPDGTRFAGLSLQVSFNGPYDVKPLTIQIDGTSGRSPGPGYSPRWAPDRNEIAYLCGGLCIAADDGTAPRVIIADQPDYRFGSFGSAPVFSHDGSSVALNCGSDLCVVDLATGTLTRSPLVGIYGSGFLWTPDDQGLVFTCQSPPDYATDICVIRKDGSELRNLTSSPLADLWPSVSPGSQ